MKSWFIKIPEKLFLQEKSGPLISTYISLMSYCSAKGYSYPSIGTIAKDLKYGQYKITNLIQELKKLKFIRVNYINSNRAYWNTLTSNEEYVSLNGPLLRYFFSKISFTGDHLSLYTYLYRNERKGDATSIPALAKFSCMSEGKVCKLLKELIDGGFIFKTKTQRANVYSINHLKEKLINNLPKNLITDEDTNCFYCNNSDIFTTSKVDNIEINICKTCADKALPTSSKTIIETVIKKNLHNERMISTLTSGVIALLKNIDTDSTSSLKINTEIEFQAEEFEILLKTLKIITKGK